ncbi:MAG: di-trans,poly-cis-decaprenylcistransferase [Candidatus Ryanbacteria bacterium RIFCSPHIGHO2_12_FULL_47_12b]|uniref:Isoprenyl transferase n=2 Tax=Candidatus Ryaniibacteriota TaxID=1817914 RepID=A0A1G2H6W7_9BACT|nr:MAG: Tritrans,polycis-undecaprenyl-diphosphate synthase (geranylgeranyl-diphosphate specific) [Parcubacteria group bacterium GW2011_GWA2_47_10b]KKU85166.1 MAG: Tritrans,polycis-undecaprenyl-diphosphate synthase (geranylgeranyl-diphosphate specific) [Parcubacteria group bacterium GW2011_GWA1_47_9]OGZ45161.1 MAG: di-trans,poly-cis-decaprenylcistransferase [Candidatus Ryanbacteria bacterium RIFCSPHIGHO2_01_FULL_48_80]OGZ49816.1 MAG: di-trans,poly-cis-decaprenylcistransferase [Candidatus Ryanbact
MKDYSIRHIAIIPDGNRRWAKAHGKLPWRGHQAGVRTYEQVLKKALELNVYCVSFWGMSTDNRLKRGHREVAFLFALFEKTLQRALASRELEKNDVRVNVLGEWRAQFPKKLVRLGERVIKETEKRKKHIMNLLLCYDGRSEMLHAFRRALASKGKSAGDPKRYLYTRNLPPVDLVIRTGGDPHLSAGFMMWDVADAQLHFSNKLWPDFTPEDFERAVKDYLRRERRFGA